MTRLTEFLYEAAEVAAVALIGVFLLFTFAARVAGVDGDSMLPTLEDGQALVLTAGPREPERGDIVVLSSNNGHRMPLVKRVIAVAGDEIGLVYGRVLVNSAEINEPYLPAGVMTYPASSGMAYPVRVPPGHVFVMGDNRGRSSDSRSDMVGFVRTDDILGKVLFRTKPFIRTDPFRFTYQVK